MKFQKIQLFLCIFFIAQAAQATVIVSLAQARLRVKVAQSLSKRNLSTPSWSDCKAFAAEQSKVVAVKSKEFVAKSKELWNKSLESLKTEQNVTQTHVVGQGKPNIAGQTNAEQKAAGFFNKNTAETHVHGDAYHERVTINHNYGSTGFWDFIKTTGDKGKVAFGAVCGWFGHSVFDQKPTVIVVEKK